MGTNTRWDPVGKEFLPPEHPTIVALDAAKAAEKEANRQASMVLWQKAAVSLKEAMAEADKRETDALVRAYVRRTGNTEADYWAGKE